MFNSLAQTITAVGEAALLGALGQFQYPQDYLPLIGPILGIEARQNTVFRIFEEQSELTPSEVYNGALRPSVRWPRGRSTDTHGPSSGYAFDTALTGSQAASLAAPFIHYCPSSNPPLFKSQGGCLERPSHLPKTVLHLALTVHAQASPS